MSNSVSALQEKLKSKMAENQEIVQQTAADELKKLGNSLKQQSKKELNTILKDIKSEKKKLNQYLSTIRTRALTWGLGLGLVIGLGLAAVTWGLGMSIEKKLTALSTLNGVTADNSGRVYLLLDRYPAVYQNSNGQWVFSLN